VEVNQHFISVAERDSESDNGRISQIPTEHLRTELSSVMSEVPYNVREIMKNPIFISTNRWAIADLPGATTATFNIPQVFLTAYSSFSMNLLTIFTFFKPTVRLHFKLNSNRFQQGILLICYDPFGQHIDALDHDVFGDASKYLSYAAMTCLPHVKIDASKSNEAYLDIPFDHVQSYLSTTNPDAVGLMGIVRVKVLNQLQTGSGAIGYADLVTYLSCVDVDMHVPVAPHTVVLPTRMVEAQLFEEIVNGAKSGYASVWNAITGNFSGAAEQAGKFFGSAGKILKSFNLDKPSYLDTAVRSVIYPMEPFGHMDGLSGAVTLGTCPTAGYLHHDEFSPSNVDELSIHKLASRYSITNRAIPWTAANGVGTTLARLPVMPRYCMQKNVNSSSSTGSAFVVPKFEHTWLSYITSLFGYWYGNIKVKVEFVSTDFHTGRLAAIFQPSVDFNLDDPVLTMGQAMQYPLMIMDLREQKEFEFEIPYQSIVARKVSTQFITDPTGVRNFDFDSRYSLGVLHFVTVNSLTAPSNVAQQIEFNVYYAAGSNMEWEYPSLANNLNCTIPTTAFRSVEAQVLTEERTQDDKPLVLTKGNVTGETTTSLNQKISDVRALAKRKSLWLNDTITVSTGSINSIPTLKNAYGGNLGIAVSPASQLIKTGGGTFPGPQTPGFYPVRMGAGMNDPSAANSWALAIARMYALWHGGMEYTIVPDTNGVNGAGVSQSPNTTSDITFSASYQPAYGQMKLGSTLADTYWMGGVQTLALRDTGNPTMQTSTFQQRSLTVKVPFVSAYNQLITEVVPADSTIPTDAQFAGALFVTATSPIASTTGFNVNMAVYGSGADDIHFSFPTSPPATIQYIVPLNAF